MAVAIAGANLLLAGWTIWMLLFLMPRRTMEFRERDLALPQVSILAVKLSQFCLAYWLFLSVPAVAALGISLWGSLRSAWVGAAVLLLLAAVAALLHLGATLPYGTR